MTSRFAGLMVVALLAFPARGMAQIEASEPVISRGQGWSMHGGRSVGNGSTAVGAEVGWPGLSASVLHGVAPKVDLGFQLGLNYGYEGLVNHPYLNNGVFGLKLQGVARVQFVDSRRFSLGVRFAPGPLFYFPKFYRNDIGLALPFDFTVGIPVGSAILLHLALDVPMWVTFGSGGGLILPILVGGGVEYFLDRDLAFVSRLRMGPALDTRDFRGRDSYFDLLFTLGVSYKI